MLKPIVLVLHLDGNNKISVEYYRKSENTTIVKQIENKILRYLRNLKVFWYNLLSNDVDG